MSLDGTLTSHIERVGDEKMHMASILVRYGFRWHSDKPSKPISHSNGCHMHIIILYTLVILLCSPGVVPQE